MQLIEISKVEEKSCIEHLDAIEDAIYAIGGKWKLRIIVALTKDKKRFNELKRSIPGISSKVLASELKELELNGLVARVVYRSKQIVVEYRLTDYSSTLHHVLNSLSGWGAMHREKVMEGL